jgi:SAM-dependent methyltransferase
MTDRTPKRNARRLYGDLAWTWPIICPPEIHLKEGDETARIMREHARIDVGSILTLGCGGGHDDHALKRHFEVTGIDLSPAMLELARRLNPEVRYVEGDMRSVRLGELFDAVLIGDSVNYMLTEADLAAAFATAFAHLEPGGVVLTAVEQTPETFEQNATSVLKGQAGDVELVFVETNYDPDPSDTTLECVFVYLIRRNGRLEIETDRHTCGIFPLETWERLLAQAGFEVVRIDDEKFPTYVGIKDPG